MPICDLLLDDVAYSVEKVTDGPLFILDNGNSITKTGMRRAFEYLNNRLEEHAKKEKKVFIKIRPHDCRHTYATALYEAAADVKMEQYLLGHADIHTTLQLYTHLSQKKMKKGVGNVLSYLNKWVTEIPLLDDE